jgi:hypothetical protein
MPSPPEILTTCAVLACACSGLDLAHAPILLLGEAPRQLPAAGAKQWKIARECFMAMLVENGYSVSDVVSLLDCSVHQVRRACTRFRECPELQEERVLH